jgi:hypothetical protein
MAAGIATSPQGGRRHQPQLGILVLAQGGAKRLAVSHLADFEQALGRVRVAVGVFAGEDLQQHTSVDPVSRPDQFASQPASTLSVLFFREVLRKQPPDFACFARQR